MIEAKFYKEQEKLEELLNGKSKFYGWMEEVKTDSQKINKEGIVIFKYNRTPYYVGIFAETSIPNIKYMQLPNGYKICYLEDLLACVDWWTI